MQFAAVDTIRIKLIKSACVLQLHNVLSADCAPFLVWQQRPIMHLNINREAHTMLKCLYNVFVSVTLELLVLTLIQLELLVINRDM